ncbi:hypothetical protein RI054_02g08010 [Pseudoscourfieldia marina]
MAPAKGKAKGNAKKDKPPPAEPGTDAGGIKLKIRQSGRRIRGAATEDMATEATEDMATLGASDGGDDGGTENPEAPPITKHGAKKLGLSSSSEEDSSSEDDDDDDDDNDNDFGRGDDGDDGDEEEEGDDGDDGDEEEDDDDVPPRRKKPKLQAPAITKASAIFSQCSTKKECMP